MKAVSEVIDGVSTNLLFFDNRRSLEDFVSENINKHLNIERVLFLRQLVKDNYHRDFYANAESFEDVYEHSKFLGLELYQNQKNKISSLLRKAESLGQIQEVPNKKLKFNDLGLGVFCFPRAAVGLRKHKRPDDTIKIVSDVRDVYAYFPQSDDDIKIISLYQYIGGNSDKSSGQLQYNGIVLMAISEYLIENGYDVEINLIYTSENFKTRCGYVVKVKSVSDELKINDLMLMVSDARWHRYKGLLNGLAMYNFFKKKLEKNFGVNGEHATKIIENIKKTDSLPIVLKRTYSEQAVMQEVNRVLGIVKNS